MKFRIPLYGQILAWFLLNLLLLAAIAYGILRSEFRPEALISGAGVERFQVAFVHRITTKLRQMTRATEKIANGQFDISVQFDGVDELGRLAQSINTMAARLDSLLRGQKRFLGDVAHELCAPIARSQMAMGILEQRNEMRDPQKFDDLREELDNMSSLVNELRSFSKASLRQREQALQHVDLSQLVSRVLHREGFA